MIPDPDQQAGVRREFIGVLLVQAEANDRRDSRDHAVFLAPSQLVGRPQVLELFFEICDLLGLSGETLLVGFHDLLAIAVEDPEVEHFTHGGYHDQVLSLSRDVTYLSDRGHQS
ncbi:MAG TPA: hypothetical protein VKA15_06795 [Isosphaeraceae bacterium]|nr:hypothetical protein [Isosphaeraceae bacterium]